MIKKTVLFSLVLMCSTLLLSGCWGPKTPQDVAKAFWQAVIDHDVQDVVKYSTLSQPQDFDGFALEWKGFKPAWGRVIIDGDEASIVTEFSGPSGDETDKRKCVTYLLRKDGVWKVDYKSTGENLHGGPLGILFGKLNQLGGELSRDLDASIKDLNVEMERLSRKLKDMTDSVAQQATKIIDRHAQELQNIMNELAESIKRALQDKHNHPSDKDRQTLREVAADLDASSQHLSSPTTASVTESNQQMGSVQQRLERIDNGITDDYKQRWQALSKQFADVMKKMVDELAMSEKSKNNPQ